MSLATLPEAERSRPDAQALIAEARAHARRRRLKLAAALILLATAVTAGVLIGRAVSGNQAATQAHPRSGPAAAHTGIVTGHLAACFAIAPQTGRPVTPGTVVVLRGRITYEQEGPGTWRLVFPKGPAVASEHISNNYDQSFRFALPPGHYVIAGRYDHSPGFATFSEATVTAGRTLRVNLPNLCM